MIHQLIPIRVWSDSRNLFQENGEKVAHIHWMSWVVGDMVCWNNGEFSSIDKSLVGTQHRVCISRYFTDTNHIRRFIWVVTFSASIAGGLSHIFDFFIFRRRKSTPVIKMQDSKLGTGYQRCRSIRWNSFRVISGSSMPSNLISQAVPYDLVWISRLWIEIQGIPFET